MQQVGLSKIVLICIACFLLAFFFSMRIFNTDKGWKHIVTSDGRGYYAYLPALLIDHDPSFSKVVAREKKLLGMPHYQPGYLVNYNGKTLNKYFAGEALLLFPFLKTHKKDDFYLWADSFKMFSFFSREWFG